jgi:hypothetical protein
MHHCAFCNNPLRRLTEWKGIDGRFYCSEFCADAGDSEMPSPSKSPQLVAATGQRQ